MNYEWAKFVGRINLVDPDTKNTVVLEVRKLADSGRFVGIDRDFIDSLGLGEHPKNPYKDGIICIPDDEDQNGRQMSREEYLEKIRIQTDEEEAGESCFFPEDLMITESENPGESIFCQDELHSADGSGSSDSDFEDLSDDIISSMEKQEGSGGSPLSKEEYLDRLKDLASGENPVEMALPSGDFGLIEELEEDEIKSEGNFFRDRDGDYFDDEDAFWDPDEVVCDGDEVFCDGDDVICEEDPSPNDVSLILDVLRYFRKNLTEAFEAALKDFQSTDDGSVELKISKINHIEIKTEANSSIWLIDGLLQINSDSVRWIVGLVKELAGLNCKADFKEGCLCLEDGTRYRLNFLLDKYFGKC